MPIIVTPSAKQPDERDRAQRGAPALVVAGRQAFDGEVQRRGQPLQRRGDGVVVAGRDAVGGQHPVRQRHQREAQLVDLLAGRQLLRRARERRAARRRVRRCASAVGTRSGVAVRRRRRRPSTAAAAACTSPMRTLAEVELAVDLERLVVVGEAEVGHAPALPAVGGLFQLRIQLAGRGDQQPAGEILVGAVERIDQADDHRGAIVLVARRTAPRPPRAGARRTSSTKKPSGVG